MPEDFKGGGWMRTLLAVLMMLSLLAGCGGNAASSEPASEAPESETPAEETAE